MRVWRDRDGAAPWHDRRRPWMDGGEFLIVVAAGVHDGGCKVITNVPRQRLSGRLMVLPPSSDPRPTLRRPN